MRTKQYLIQICLLVAVLLPAVVQAQFTFTTNNETITITGYTGTNTVVVIPDMTNGYPVTSIAGDAFYSTHIISVTIPASVTRIGDYAFFNCTNLTAIIVDAANPSYSDADGVLFNKDQTILMQFPFGKTGSYSIPDTVTMLADEAFGMRNYGQFPSDPFSYSACPGLTNLVIPGSVTNIDDSAFSHCTGLISVTLANGVVSIGTNAFSWCLNLIGITIPSSVTSIDDSAFHYSGLTKVVIPGSVTHFGWGAFANSSLTNVIIQDGVPCIGEHAFDYCPNLKSVTIPGSVTNIGDYAFIECVELVNVNLANGVSDLGTEAFAGCFQLAHIDIPNSLTSIGGQAFWFCAALTNITIPSSVTNIGSYAFSVCSSLANINVDPNNAFYSSVDGVLFNEDQTTLIQFPGGRGGSYTVPSSVASISSYSFGNYLSTIAPSLPPAGANLVNVTVPGSVTNIGGGAFNYLINLTGIYFEGNTPVLSGSIVQFLSGGSTSGFSGGWWDGNKSITVYYLPGTMGWDTTFGDVPTGLWLPAMQTVAAGFNVQTNQFSFNIQWASGQTVVVEACTNLSNSDWQPVQTNTLTGGSAYFSDPQWTNYPGRFYRLRSL